MHLRDHLGLTLGCLALLCASQQLGDNDSIRHGATDSIRALQDRLNPGAASLPSNHDRRYLPAVLKELGDAEQSQLLAGSKTSCQRDRISQNRMPAVYFNE